MTDLATHNPGSDLKRDDLLEIIQAYNEVTLKLQDSHETLTAEVQRLQEQLASANAALQRSKRLAALGEMAAGIAHEIRNPLASIQLYAKMLDTDLADRPEQQSIAVKIASAVRGLNAIVTDVLSFAREMKVRLVEGSAQEMLERAAETVKPLIDAAAIQIVYHTRPADLLIRYDVDLMHQAMVNLVRNAAQAMDKGGVLTLSAIRQRNGSVHITVRDTGPGISEQDIDRIFNPFFTTRATGTGLGLAIVHRIVDAHGGTIAATNAADPDHGAIFTLQLPGEPAARPQRTRKKHTTV
jgi:two-component system sensor histidine kinase HydH